MPMLLTSIRQLVKRVLTYFRQLAKLSIARHVDVAISIELGWAGVEMGEVDGYICLVARTRRRSREQKMGAGTRRRAGINRDNEGNQMTGSRIQQLATGRRDEKTTKRGREIGATERKNGFKENDKEVNVEVDFLLPKSEEEKEDWRQSARKKKGFKEKEKVVKEKNEEEKRDWCRSAGRKKGFKGAGVNSGARQARGRQ
ncbi:hypothetical protein ACLOJK_030786 [Asimina triloba]